MVWGVLLAHEREEVVRPGLVQEGERHAVEALPDRVEHLLPALLAEAAVQQFLGPAEPAPLDFDAGGEAGLELRQGRRLLVGGDVVGAGDLAADDLHRRFGQQGHHLRRVRLLQAEQQDRRLAGVGERGKHGVGSLRETGGRNAGDS